MSASIHKLGHMTEEQYKQERQDIEDNCLVGVEAKARKEQRLADLMYRSGMTQSQLAKIERIDQSTVTRMVLFGRFIKFMATTHKTEFLPKNLTLYRFRSYWLQTDGQKQSNERKRFSEVIKLIEEDLKIVSRPRGDTKKIADQIIEEFSDGKWHHPETIANHIEISVSDANNILAQIFKSKRKGIHTEKRKYGKGWQYRIVKGGHQIDLDVLNKEIQPLLAELIEQGKRNTATISPGTVLTYAMRIERLLKKLAR